VLRAAAEELRKALGRLVRVDRMRGAAEAAAERHEGGVDAPRRGDEVRHQRDRAAEADRDGHAVAQHPLQVAGGAARHGSALARLVVEAGDDDRLVEREALDDLRLEQRVGEASELTVICHDPAVAGLSQQARHLHARDPEQLRDLAMREPELVVQTRGPADQIVIGAAGRRALRRGHRSMLFGWRQRRARVVYRCSRAQLFDMGGG